MSLSSLVDTVVMRSRLVAAGFEPDVARDLYGAYSTQCVSLFNLPPVLIYPVAYVIVPLVAECVARREKQRMDRILDSSFRMTAMIALPCALGMAAIPKYVLSMIFNSESSSVMAPLLSVLALAVFFIGVLATSNCALQGVGQERLPIFSMLAGRTSSTSPVQAWKAASRRFFTCAGMSMKVSEVQPSKAWAQMALSLGAGLRASGSRRVVGNCTSVMLQHPSKA